jgi:hypothetical protein
MAAKLVGYVKDRLNEGNSVDDIKKKLELHKHRQKDIDNAFMQATIEYDKGLIATEMGHFRRILIMLILLLVIAIFLMVART